MWGKGVKSSTREICILHIAFWLVFYYFAQKSLHKTMMKVQFIQMISNVLSLCMSSTRARATCCHGFKWRRSATRTFAPYPYMCSKDGDTQCDDFSRASLTNCMDFYLCTFSVNRHNMANRKKPCCNANCKDTAEFGSHFLSALLWGRRNTLATSIHSTVLYIPPTKDTVTAGLLYWYSMYNVQCTVYSVHTAQCKSESRSLFFRGSATVLSSLAAAVCCGRGVHYTVSQKKTLEATALQCVNFTASNPSTKSLEPHLTAT